MQLLGISGSLRPGSYNTALLHAASSILGDRASLTIADIGDIPLYRQDREAEGETGPVAALRSAIAQADGVIIATPEYNYSFPGGLKNTLDWMSRGSVRPLTQKPVLIIGASGGLGGTIRAQIALRTVLFAMDAIVMNKPELLVRQAQHVLKTDGTITDDATRAAFEKVLAAYLPWVRGVQALRAVLADA